MRRVTRRATDHVRQLPPAGVLALGWAIVLGYAFPGIMTLDSFDHLREGRYGIYTDGHPPVLSAIWGEVDAIVAGPAGMFVIQTAAFLLGVHAWLRHTFTPRRAAWLAVAVTLFPPLLAPMGVIWKDAVMAAFLILGLAGLRAPRRGVRVAALVAVFVATAVRYNTPAATLPLVVLLFEWSPTPATWRGRLRRYAISTTVWVAFTAGALLLNAGLTDKPMHFWHSSAAVMDIAGTIAFIEPALSDEELRRELAPTEPLIDAELHARIRARYLPYDFTPLIFGDGRIWSVPIMGDTPAPPAQRAGIERAWQHFVLGYPGAYLRHRIAAFANLLGVPRNTPAVLVQTARGQHIKVAVFMGLSTRTSSLQNWMQRKLEHVAKRTPLFRPWIYLVLALVFLPLGRRHRDVFALLLSGILLELSLFPLAGTPDFRYSHWLVLCTTLAAIMLVARRARSGRDRMARERMVGTGHAD